MSGGILAVALHDVEPATFERCALIRDWLADQGVDRVTLLVIPAPDLHPFFERRPDLAHWLLDRRDAGDAIAQHGLEHRRRRRAAPGRGVVAGWPRAEAAEYPGLDAAETRASVRAGRRILELAGLPPRGFVAPGYAYTPALRRELDGTFDWWATLTAVRRVHGSRRVPALGLGTSDAVRRTVSPLLVGAASYLCRDLVRLDVHPADFDHPRHVLAVERVLRAARDRIAVTYDELARPRGPERRWAGCPPPPRSG